MVEHQYPTLEHDGCWRGGAPVTPVTSELTDELGSLLLELRQIVRATNRFEFDAPQRAFCRARRGWISLPGQCRFGSHP